MQKQQRRGGLFRFLYRLTRVVSMLPLTISIGILLLPSTLVTAATRVTVKVTVVAPPCKISEGGKIDINFGERVGVKKVDGVNYRMLLPYSIRCEPGATKDLDLTLTLISRRPTGYDSAAIQTNLPNLGIRVLQDGQPFTLNKPLVIDLSNPPQLEAVPVKTPGATLTEGAFMATATLRAEYQ